MGICNGCMDDKWNVNVKREVLPAVVQKKIQHLHSPQSPWSSDDRQSEYFTVEQE